jgi:predicted transcriptional regulator
MQRTVREWMSRPVVVAHDTMVLPAARALLRMRKIRRLPVVDAAGSLVGLVTEGDINRISDSHIYDVRAYNLYHDVADLPLSVFMSRSVVSVPPDMAVIDVARLLLRHKIGGVPVVEQGHVVGIITESDLFRLLIEDELSLAEAAADTAVS